MADYLLKAPVTTSEPPQSQVTPGQVASPYTQLAHVLDLTGESINRAGEAARRTGEAYDRAFQKVGAAADEIAVPLAEKAGYEAGANATVGPDGKVQPVEAPLMIGPASVAFARAARFTELAKLQPEIENRLTEIKVEHKDDPAGFKAASDAYKQEIAHKYTDPAISAAATKVAEDTAGSYYRQTVVQADNVNATNALTALKSTLSDKSNRLADLAFNGQHDSSDYKQTASDIKTIYAQLNSDPRMNYPKERVDSELREMDAQNTVHSIAGQAIRMMDKDSPTARADAKKFLIDKVYGDPDLNLTMSQRHQAVTTAMGLMEARSAENKALIDGNKAITTTLLSQLQSTQAYNPIQVNDAIEKARRIGDAESFYKLTYAQGMHEWDSTVRSLPLPQQLAAGRALESASPIEGRLMASESSGNPRLVNKLGYAGLYQFGAPRLADLGVYKPGPDESLKDWSKTPANAPGKWSGTFDIPGHPEVKTINDFLSNPDAQRAAYGTHQGKMDQEIKTLGLDKYEGQNVGGVVISRNALYGMMHLGGAQGTADALASGGVNAARDANGTSVMDYARKFAGGGGAGQAWFDEARTEQVKRFRTYLSAQAPAMVDTFTKQVNAAGDVPLADLKNLNDVLAQTGRADLRNKVDEALMAHYGVKELDALPTADRQAWITQTTPEAAQDALKFRVQQHMAATIDANAKAMVDTPYSTWSMRTSAPPPSAYNFDNPDQVTGVAAKRVAAQKAFRNNDRSPPTSVFEGKEADAFGSTLTNGDPAKAAQSLGGLANLPDDVYGATMAQKPVAEAVTGMMSSKDPVRMSAGMAAVDKLWRTNPADAQAAFGGAAITKLQAWQALKGSFNAVELAERLNAADDPSTLRARQDAKEAAETETKSLSPADMAYKLGTSMGIPIVSRVANVVTGATPNVPFDSIKGGELVNDYRSTYTALRAYGVDADKASNLAVQRLSATWGISQAAGNQVMKNPPERFYPSIEGNQDWIQQDLRDWITKRAGSEFVEGPRYLEVGPAFAGRDRNWSIEGMISDGQTQAEIGAGKPPSYQVAIKKADGTLQIMPQRVAFDPADHMAKHGEDLDRRRQTVNFLRAGGGTGMPQPFMSGADLGSSDGGDTQGGNARFGDFAKSGNIEDRRGDPNQVDWRGMATSIKNAILGDPKLAEVPPSKLAEQLGLNDIKTEPNVGPSALEDLIGSIQDSWNSTKKTFSHERH